MQAVQAWMLSTFLLFILLTSNPFERQAVVAEGQDLNPILQDIGLAIHPPMLYLGYVGFSITFAFAIAALIDGKIDSAWARWVRPWAMIAWVFLTAGIAMGSYWGLLRTRLGWLVVLGPGGKCILPALALGNSPAAFRSGDGKAGGLENLDRIAGHPDVFPVLAGNISGPVRRAHLGAYFCERPRHVGCSYWRF